MRELGKVDEFKAPRDKLICLVNCCKVIMNSLASNAGADDFFPVLLYVVVKALPPNLDSNLQYIQRFRRSSRLAAESAYFLTHLISATHFLEKVDASQLNIDPATYARLVNGPGAAAEPASTSRAAGDLLDLTSSPGDPGLFSGLVVAPAAAATATATATPPTKERAGSVGPGSDPRPPRMGSEAPGGGLESLPSAHDLLSAVEDRRPIPPVAALMKNAATSLFAPLNPLNLRTAGNRVGSVLKEFSGGAAGRGPGTVGGPSMNQLRQQQQQQQGPGAAAPSGGASVGMVTVPVVQYPTLESLEAVGWPLVLDAEAAGALASRHRFLYAQPGDLTLKDVERLLAAYKELALRHECLVRAVDAISLGTVDVDPAAAAPAGSGALNAAAGAAAVTANSSSSVNGVPGEPVQPAAVAN